MVYISTVCDINAPRTAPEVFFFCFRSSVGFTSVLGDRKIQDGRRESKARRKEGRRIDRRRFRNEGYSIPKGFSGISRAPVTCAWRASKRMRRRMMVKRGRRRRRRRMRWRRSEEEEEEEWDEEE